MVCLGHWLGPVTMHVWLGPTLPYGPGWAQPENKKKFFEKICDFPQKIYCILINIGVYFYIVKIQIRY
jgi:hypothetical protein